MKRKSFLFLLLVLLSIPVFTSCGEKTPEADDRTEVSAEDAVTLPFRITWKEYSGRGEAIRKIVTKYNGEQTGAVIQMIGGDEDRAVIQSLLESDPNMVYVLPYRYVQYFGDLGYLADLTTDFKNEKYLFYPAIWQLGTVEKKAYGVPWMGHSMCLLYNKTLLRQAGVDPATIKDTTSFAAALAAIEEKTNAAGIGLVGADGNDVSWMVNQFVYGFGSELVSPDGKTVTINNEKAAAAITYYRDVLGSYAQSSWKSDSGAEVMTAFLEQKVAFEIQGIWGVTDIEKNGAPFEVGILSMEEIGMCAEVGPMMLAVSADCSGREKEEAIRFMQFLLSEEAQTLLMNGEYSVEHDAYYPFRTPIRIDLADSPYFKSYPEYLVFIEGFENPSIDVPVPEWQSVKEEFYGPGLHRVMTGQMSIEDFLTVIETEGNKALQAQ